MKIQLKNLRSLIRETLLEITRTQTLTNGNVDYDEFVNWAKGKADEISPGKDFEKFGDLSFQWADGGEDVKIIAYKDDQPIGYVSIEPFQDGHKINTLGLKPSARGGGIAGKIYDYIISKTNLYSDQHQTPEARKLWMRLFDRYKMLGFDIKSGETFEVKKSNGELMSMDPNYELYSDDEDSQTCLVIIK